LLTAILPFDIGPGQVGSRVTHQLHNVGRVGSGQKKSDPCPTLRYLSLLFLASMFWTMRIA